jgi:hypothetical protein
MKPWQLYAVKWGFLTILSRSTTTNSLSLHDHHEMIHRFTPEVHLLIVHSILTLLHED